MKTTKTHPKTGKTGSQTGCKSNKHIETDTMHELRFDEVTTKRTILFTASVLIGSLIGFEIAHYLDFDEIMFWWIPISSVLIKCYLFPGDSQDGVKVKELTKKETILITVSVLIGFALSIYIASITSKTVGYIGAITTIVVVNKLFTNK